MRVIRLLEAHGLVPNTDLGQHFLADENIVDQGIFALSKPDGSADLGAVGRYLIRDPRR